MTRRSFLAALPAAAIAQSPSPGTQIYDLLLKNGHVLDPKNGRNGRLDVAVVAGKIARVAPDLPAAHARLVVEAQGCYLTPGLIDIHAHVDEQAEGNSLQPDHHALTNGVTTVVDAGDAGHRDFEAYQRRTLARSRTRVLAWLNISAGGITAADGPFDAAPCAAAIQKHSRFLVGVRAGKAEAIGPAVEAAKAAGVPVLSDVYSPALRPGDIFSGAYPEKGPADARAGRERGVLLDTSSFWFRTAAPALRSGLLPDTISTNLNKANFLLERTDMMPTLSKFLNLGLTVEQLIERVTVNAAKAIRRPDLGHLGEGAPADLALLAVEEGSFGFLDAGHRRLPGGRRLRCVLTARAGRVVFDADGLSLTEWTHAGPYSNYK